MFCFFFLTLVVTVTLMPLLPKGPLISFSSTRFQSSIGEGPSCLCGLYVQCLWLLRRYLLILKPSLQIILCKSSVLASHFFQLLRKYLSLFRGHDVL